MKIFPKNKTVIAWERITLLFLTTVYLREVAILAVLAAGGSCGAKFEQKNRFFFPYFYTMIETY